MIHQPPSLENKHRLPSRFRQVEHIPNQYEVKIDAISYRANVGRNGVWSALKPSWPSRAVPLHDERSIIY